MAKPSRPARGAGERGRRRSGAAAPVNGAAKAWAGRFDDTTDALVELYTSSATEDARLVPADIAGSIAHCEMLARQKIITRKDADAIQRGLLEILHEYEDGNFRLRDSLEDVHMNIEARLAAKIGPVAGRLHTARSRNDQVVADLRLHVREASADIAEALVRLQHAILTLAETNRAVIMPGYTHLQRGQPVLMAHHLLAYVEMFERDVTRFAFSYNAADKSPLGSGALAGVTYPIDRKFVADEIGFGGITANSIDAVSDRDFIVDFVNAAALTMVHISRLSEELVLWSSAEFGFITLPDSFATGSSIMPQKKNADVAELARGRTGRVIGNSVALLTMLKGLPLSYNRDMQESKLPLFEAEDTLAMTLAVMTRMLPRITVNAERAKAAAVANYSLATDFADYLARKGIPFREAHEAVGKLVRYAETKGATLDELSLAEMRRFSPLFDEDARKIDVTASLRARDVPGGTAPRQVSAAMRKARRRVDKMLAEIEEDE